MATQKSKAFKRNALQKDTKQYTNEQPPHPATSARGEAGKEKGKEKSRLYCDQMVMHVCYCDFVKAVRLGDLGEK
jgi:hypothetical protein